jgi:hypothetical protein
VPEGAVVGLPQAGGTQRPNLANHSPFELAHGTFDDDGIHRVARQLNTVLTAPVDGDCVTYFLKGQVLVTTTVLLIELDAAHLDSGLLASFVELLLQVRIASLRTAPVLIEFCSVCIRYQQLDWKRLVFTSGKLTPLVAFTAGAATHQQLAGPRAARDGGGVPHGAGGAPPCAVASGCRPPVQVLAPVDCLVL